MSSRRPLYLQADGVPVFGMLHTPPDSSASPTSVLLCAPFGWEEVCSHRSRRVWADQLAGAGYPALRIDLPASGDSGGSPAERGWVEPWIAAVRGSAEWLQTNTAAERIAAIGVGLGGLLILAAIAQDAPIDEAVLWAVPSRGRHLLRELRAFASLEGGSSTGRDGASATTASTSKELMAGGFVLGEETARALEQLDATHLQLHGRRLRRALVLDRDGANLDERLVAFLEDAGANVTVAEGTGYGAMVAEPEAARAPRHTYSQVSSWLQASPPAPEATRRNGASDPTLAASLKTTVTLTVDGVPIEETPITLEQPFGELFGVLSHPAGAPLSGACAVLLNAGAVRHIGPNRMWVEAARRWAAKGVPALRLDLEGIGDADGDGERLSKLAELYVPELVVQVRAALDALDARGLGPNYLLGGLCSGAFWAFHAALQDDRVTAAMMLNPRALFWDSALASREIAHEARRALLRNRGLSRVIRGQVRPSRVISFATRAAIAVPAHAMRRGHGLGPQDGELTRALDTLRDAEKSIHLMFSGDEPLHEELERAGILDRLDQWPNMSLKLLPGEVHTLRPLHSQRATHEALDRALEDSLSRIAQPRYGPER